MHNPCQACRRHGAKQNIPTMHESITPRLSTRPDCDTLLRLVVFNAVDAHHSTTCLQLLATTPKMMPQEVERHRKRHNRLIRDTHIWGFPGASQASRVGYNGDAFIKVTTQHVHASISLHDRLSFPRSHDSLARCKLANCFRQRRRPHRYARSYCPRCPHDVEVA
jgi:hypothetical protein